MEKLYGLDLFSGIGGITKALEEWVRPIAYCERDRYAQAVLLSRMQSGDLPLAPIWDDVQSLPADLPTEGIDIIYGGFPCQDISVAGTGAGLAGERSGLFKEIVRLAEELKPAFLFLENVPAIRTRGLDRVIEELTKVGYDLRWLTLSAAEIGANHKRERWFLLAHAKSEQGGRLPFTGVQSDFRNGGTSVADTSSTSRRDVSSGETSPHTQSSDDGWWKIEPNVGRVVDELPCRVDRLRGLGNAVVPRQAKEAFKILMGLR